MHDVIAKLEEENKKHLRNMREMAEKSCKQKRTNGFPCSKEICSKFNTPQCLHPEEAGFPAQRY